ncbi:MAG TPA: hypothetical protein PKA58_26305, partial [Polyangium sp.]|nr:hypothetical protein [Polyangium sp.]
WNRLKAKFGDCCAAPVEAIVSSVAATAPCSHQDVDFVRMCPLFLNAWMPLPLLTRTMRLTRKRTCDRRFCTLKPCTLHALAKRRQAYLKPRGKPK